MKVLLTTTIKKLGKMGESVSVKPGYARNFLFPNKMALREKALIPASIQFLIYQKSMMVMKHKDLY